MRATSSVSIRGAAGLALVVLAVESEVAVAAHQAGILQ
jgi:hypothetical protein